MVQRELGSLRRDNRDWPIFVGQEPNIPDTVMVVYNTEGIRFGRLQINGEQPEHYGIQVLVRSTDSETGWNKANDVVNLFNKQVMDESVTIPVTGEEIDATYLVHSLSRRSGPLDLGRDEDNSSRHLHTINYTVVITEVETGTGT